MNHSYFVDRLAKNRGVFEGLVRGVSLEQAKWKPAAEQWSILEVVNHLYDEEREDFRARFESVIVDPKKPWPPIDPRNWVTNRGYNQRDLDTSLNNFISERDKSLSWLSQLTTPAWENRYEHADGRSLAAGDLLASWLAHDFLHIRQLARLHWQYTGAIADPYQTTYAGPWKES